jgi:myo-inositol-1(or 4)-monophosphatase
VLGERFIGVNSEAELHTHNTRQRIRVQPCEDLSQAVLCATHPYAYFTEDQQQAFRRVADATRMTRFNGDCYIFALLALGFVDLVIESTLHRWDVAALIPVVEGAGGIITDWKGNRCDDGGQVLAASDPRIHAQAMKLLAG